VFSRKVTACLAMLLYWGGGTLILRSQESAPPAALIAQGYLYIEPYQTRFETLFSLSVALDWLGIPFDAATPLSAEAQSQFETRGREFGMDLAKLISDGMHGPGRLTLVTIVKGEPGRTEPMKDGDPVNVRECMAGFMWEFPTGIHPQNLRLQWRGLRDPVKNLPVRILFGTETETQEFTELITTINWNNQKRLPPPRPLSEVPSFEMPAKWRLPIGASLWFLGGLGMLMFLRANEKKIRQSFFFAWLLGAAIMIPILNIEIEDPFDKSGATGITKDAAQKIAEALVGNVYRAFDFQTETQIYDALERSADGELLRKLYLEISQALTLNEREGTKARITEFALDVDEVTALEDRGFKAESTWTALGNVTHWGHNHVRTNKYTAHLTVSPVDGGWKLTALDVIEGRRL
jgi:hypothetical protein